MGSAIAAGYWSMVQAVDADQARPGLVGFAVVLAMAVALYFLLRSLAKHLRRVDVDRDAREASEDESRSPQSGDGPIE